MTTDPRPRRSSRLRRATLRLALLLVAWGVAEAAARVAYRPLSGEAFGTATRPEDAPVDAPDLRTAREQAGLGMRDAAMCLHPFFGYVYTPPAPGAEPGPVAISPEGFLDGASLVRKRDDRRTLVAILGGSVAGQLGTWHSELLRRALLERGVTAHEQVELVRLGMPGYHQPQELQQLAYLLALGGELDVLLELDGFNEIAVPAALNAPRGTGPLFPMNWSMVALDVPDLPVRRDIGAIEFLGEERRRRAEGFEASWRARSAVGRLFWRLDDQRLGRAIGRHARDLQGFRLDEAPFFVGGPALHHDPPGGLVPFCVDVWKESSLAMHALCEANGIRYLHFLQPNQYLPDSKPLSDQERSTAYEAESPYRTVVEQGYPLLQAAGEELRARGVAFFDLSQAFAGIEDTLYVDDCCHYQRPGQRDPLRRNRRRDGRLARAAAGGGGGSV